MPPSNTSGVSADTPPSLSEDCVKGDCEYVAR
jgi:hypothetical protein